MTEKKHSSRLAEVKALLANEPDVMKVLVKEALQEVLDAEMTEFLGADRNERSAERMGYRSGYYSRGLVTRIGTLELRVPRIAAVSFRRRCLSATSAARRLWWRPWPRCTCKGCRRAR
jgi:transposase-like protein